MEKLFKGSMKVVRKTSYQKAMTSVQCENFGDRISRHQSLTK